MQRVLRERTLDFVPVLPLANVAGGELPVVVGQVQRRKKTDALSSSRVRTA